MNLGDIWAQLAEVFILWWLLAGVVRLVLTIHQRFADESQRIDAIIQEALDG